MQIKSSKKLAGFVTEIRAYLIKLSIIYWYDTVININKIQSSLRYYGNDDAYLFKAHEHKDEEGISEDDILNALAKNVTVIHDHNKINYKYSYQNIEYNVYLIRDLEKCYFNINHAWCKKFKELVQKNIHDKKLYTENSYDSFDDVYLNNFNQKCDEILLDGLEKIRTSLKNIILKRRMP